MAEENSSAIRGSARLSPLDMLPGLGEDQKQALRDGRPVPPSPEWLAAYEAARPVAADRPVAGSPGLPLVVGILCHEDPSRLKLARKAVNYFVGEQVYPNRKLVIVNAGESRVTTVEHAMVAELMVRGDATTLGQLRNIGLDHAATLGPAGSVRFVLWDDDDYSHPHRLALQVAVARPGRAVLLEGQIRFDVVTAAAYFHHEAGGLPGTGLYPLTDARFPGSNVGEDRAFWMQHWSFDTDVLANVTEFGGANLSIATYHNRNVLSRERFMVDHAAPEHHGRWALPPSLVEHLKGVLSSYGFEVGAHDEEKDESDLVDAAGTDLAVAS